MNEEKKAHITEKVRISIKCLLWLIGFILALYTIAFYRYAHELRRFQYKVSHLTKQLERDNASLSMVPKLMSHKIPYKPEICSPWSTIRSLLSTYNTFDDDIVDELQDAIVIRKNKLANLNLASLILVDKDMSYTNFVFSNLSGATLYRNNLMKSNFKHAKLINTNFTKSYLVESDFSHSDLAYTDFSKSNLRNANFRKASIYSINLTEALIAGADLRETDLTIINKDYLKGAMYNSKKITLDKVLNESERHLLCSKSHFKEFNQCLYKVAHEAVYPTKFPSGFNPKAYGMIDIVRPVKTWR